MVVLTLIAWATISISVSQAYQSLQFRHGIVSHVSLYIRHNRETCGIYEMIEIRKGKRIEPSQDERFVDSLNKLHSGCNGCVNVGCIIPSIIITIILFIGLFGNDLGL